MLTPLDLFGADEEEAIAEEPTTPILRAKARVDETLTYLRTTGNTPKRHQIVNMLDELSRDLGAAA